jgi:hypothetical protein
MFVVEEDINSGSRSPLEKAATLGLLAPRKLKLHPAGECPVYHKITRRDNECRTRASCGCAGARWRPLCVRVRVRPLALAAACLPLGLSGKVRPILFISKENPKPAHHEPD